MPRNHLERSREENTSQPVRPRPSNEIKRLAERTEMLQKQQSPKMKDHSDDSKSQAAKSLGEASFPTTAEGYVGAFLKTMGFKKEKELGEVHPVRVVRTPGYIPHINIEDVTVPGHIQELFKQEMGKRTAAAIQSREDNATLTSYYRLDPDMKGDLTGYATRGLVYAAEKALSNEEGTTSLPKDLRQYEFPAHSRPPTKLGTPLETIIEEDEPDTNQRSVIEFSDEWFSV